MDRISQRVFIGNSHDARHSRDQLKEAGVTAVLNVAKDLDNPFLSPDEFLLYKVGLGDGSGNPEENLVGAVKTLHGLLSAGHTVLIHCHEGRSRSASVLSAYLWASGLYPSMDDALAYLKSIRPVVRPENGMRQDYIGLGVERLREVLRESP